MSAKNKLPAKQARRADRVARKGAFEPQVISFEVPDTKIVVDEETDEEVSEVVKTVGTNRWFHLPSRADRRGNRTKARRGTGI